MASVPDLRDTWRIELREHGLTLKWLAVVTETPVATVYSYSIGKRRPSDAWMKKVAEALKPVRRAA